MRKYQQPQPLVIQASSMLLMLAIISMFALTGCGQKGDLYLPESSDSSAKSLPAAATQMTDVHSPAMPVSEATLQMLPDEQDY